MVDWLKGYISDKCPYCGSDMQEQVNDDGKITNRYCSNIKTCPGHNAAKVVDMMKILKIDNIGFKTALDVINMNHLNSHIEYLNYIPVEKLTMDLKTALRLLCINGVDKQFVTECEKNGIATLDDLKKLPPKLLRLVQLHQDEFLYMLTRIKLKEPEVPVNKDAHIVVIMITGPVNGYKNKEEFVDAMNLRFQKHLRFIHQETKRKTGVDFLIKEPSTNTRGKLEAALSAGIPVVTSQQFIELMEELCKQLEST